MYWSACTLLLSAVLASAAPSSLRNDPFGAYVKENVVEKRDALTLDLGYEIYQGQHNKTSNIDSWLGSVQHEASR
jgi:hypothetical protein